MHLLPIDVPTGDLHILEQDLLLLGPFTRTEADICRPLSFEEQLLTKACNQRVVQVCFLLKQPS